MTTDQIVYWNEDGGRRWASAAERTTTIFEPITRALLDFAAPQPGERVLDVGCGSGATVLELSRCVEPGGRVLGVDVSRVILAKAETLVGAAGSSNVELLLADGATHDFERAFDLVFSQFGVMFFAEPVAAFANLRRALVAGGRLAFACWREPEANPWMTVALEAAKPFGPPLDPIPPDAPGPFAFKDDARVRAIVSGAGFRDVNVVRRDHRLRMGARGERAAAAHMASVGAVGRLLADVDAETKTAAIDAIHKTFERHTTGEGIVLAASVWFVSAKA